MVAHRRGALAVVSPARALMDFARWDTPTSHDLAAVTIACLQQRATSPENLDFELERAGQSHLAGLRRGLKEFTQGAWSRPEATLHRLLHAGGFPRFVMNHRLVDANGLTIGTPDAYFPDQGTVVQVHSKAHHQGWDGDGTDLWSQTVHRDNRYAAAGLAVVAVTPTTLAREVRPFLKQLTDTVHRRYGMATPHLTMTCPPACNKIHAVAPLSSHAQR